MHDPGPVSRRTVVTFYHALLSTLAGPILAVAAADGLRHLMLLPEHDTWRLALARLTSGLRAKDDLEDRLILTQDPDRFKPLALQLGEYFVGQRRAFDIQLAPHGTDFQRRVWQRLSAIPYGEIRSYGRLAADLGAPQAAQAVGQAASQNPLLILIPCHRLLGKNGRLVGFSAGVELKARLLRLEGHTLASGYRIRPPQLF
jgi:methylated-DNA-[protein]-cysteine S-methyltransferase